MMVVDRNMQEPSNFNVNFKVLINVNLLVDELCEYQNARCNDKKNGSCSYQGRGAYVLFYFYLCARHENPYTSVIYFEMLTLCA